MDKRIVSNILSLFLLFPCISFSNAQIADFGHVNFTKADSIASLYPDHSLKDLRLLSDNLTKPLTTDVEKFRAIYKWVCGNIENDYGGYKKNKYKRKKLRDRPEELKEWEIRFSSKSFQRLVKKHKTVCTGYAYLIRELSYFAGISCEIIHGYGRNVKSNIGGQGIPNHSWNAVQLNGKWYLCDPTWSSGAIHLKETKFIKHFNEEYFLAKPSLFVLNHYPLDASWLFTDKKTSLKTFLNAPLIYKSAYQYQLTSVFPKQFNVEVVKGQKVLFEFISRDTLVCKELKLKVIQGNFQEEKNASIKGNKFTFEHAFATSGTYVVHLLVNNDYTISYEVKVRREIENKTN